MAFSVSVENGSSPVIHLTDGIGNCAAEIYSFGALLNAFVITNGGNSYNVIEGFASPQQAKGTITAGFKSAKLSPFVCRVADGRYAYKEEIFKINKFYLESEAIHGLIFDAPFTIIETGSSEESAWVTLGYNYSKTDEGYPFRYNTQVTYSLKKDATLTITTVVTNTGDKDMPLADGWHPYFTLGSPSINELLIQINAERILEFNPKLVPTGSFAEYSDFSTPKPLGETFFDNCFVVADTEKPAFTIKNESLGLRLSILALTGYPFLQIYTPPHRKSIAVENLSGAPDAFNNGIGLIIAKPHEQYTFAANYTLQFEHNK